ncbi:MAG: enoyl-CoA hydratase/isomerase family protein [Pseudomonadota bacterium]|nr:enoyl-CoA hydratase/isomerase family protein [Pseudomonadota bacterium]
MTEENVLLSNDQNDIRILTLNRPDKLNAMNEAMVRGLIAAVEKAHEDDGVAAIILTGNGRAFSAGADIKEAETRKGFSSEQARHHSEASLPVYQLGRQTDKPVIAAVKGFVLGGGCNLAIATDMVIAGENALFGYPEVKRGMGATMVTPGLVHRIGPKAAYELLMLGENISADKALALGLINRVVPDDKVLDEALGIATKLAAYNQRAIRATKRCFIKSTELSLDASLDSAMESMLQLRTSK